MLGVTDEMKIAHDEIFGPILPIFGYGNIDDAIDYVNADASAPGAKAIAVR